MANKVADEGNLFVCMACGKTSKDRYGEQKISAGWDESCMINSTEVEISRILYSEDGECVVTIRDKPSGDADGTIRPNKTT